MHTALVRRGYVEQVWLHTPKASIDARAHDGALVETRGDVAPGMRFVDGAFVLAPPKIRNEVIAAEAQRRIDGVFPSGVRNMLAGLGGAPAVIMQRYVTEVHRTAEAFMLAETVPTTFRDNAYWPSVPDLGPVPVASPDAALASQTPPPINIHVAPVINSQAADRSTEPIVINPPQVVVRQQEAARDGVVGVAPRAVPAFSEDAAPVRPKFDGHESLDAWKAALVEATQATYEQHKEGLSAVARARFLETMADFAAQIIEAETAEGVEAAKASLMRFIEGQGQWS